MIKYFITGALFLLSAKLFAEESYYLNTLKDCYVASYENGNLIKVANDKFINKILNTKNLPRNPNLVAFKLDDQIYVTNDTCVMSATKKEISNQLNGREDVKKKTENFSEKEKFNSYKHYVEFDTGIMKISDQNSVAEDYNQVFPSTSASNPTSWGTIANSSYSANPLLSFGFGFRSNATRFLAFKIRLLSGKKTDAVDLIDLNTSISESGAWTYKDSFKNFYVGFKYIFLDYSAWKPVFGAYLGVSQMTSTLADGSESFKLSSIGPAALVEAGIEYHLNSHWGLGSMFGYEYLGKKTLKFSDESMGKSFKTNMSYSNLYVSFGVKFYFK